MEELYDIFGDSDRLPTMQDFNEMKYLERCIKETVRLYPSVPIIARQLREDAYLSKLTDFIYKHYKSGAIFMAYFCFLISFTSLSRYIHKSWECGFYFY